MEEYKYFFSFLSSIVTISESDFEESSVIFKERKFEKGKLWIKKGKTCKEIAFITTGLLRTFITNSEGDDITTCFCAEKRMTTSLESFISQTPSDISIQALDDTELILINHSALQRLYKTKPVWHEISRILIEKEYLSLYRYAKSLSTETAKQKYMRLIEEQPQVLLKAPIQYIASYLGVSRETLSRIRKQVADDIM